jgi:large subunit ribosomal protein L32
MKKRMRRAASRWRAPKFQSCPECGAAKPGHIACPSCGFYDSRKVAKAEMDA